MLNSNKVTNAITASGTVSATAYSGQCNYYIFGKFCYILGEFTYTANYTPQDTQPIFMGLPIPVQSCYITAIQFLGKANATLHTGSIPFRMRIDEAGTIRNWYSGISTVANNPAVFSSVYLIK